MIRAACVDLATRGCSILGTYSTPESKNIFETLTDTITLDYSSTQEQGTQSHPVPKLVGVPADISNPQTPIPLILESLRKHFNGKVDIVIFNAAVMGLARMGEGSMTADFVDVALLGNVKFPIMLMESFVKEAIINKEGRVVSISSEGVRAKRPPGG
jgi:3-oxoacyl-[acyl-carrier protein] reductase